MSSKSGPKTASKGGLETPPWTPQDPQAWGSIPGPFWGWFGGRFGLPAAVLKQLGRNPRPRTESASSWRIQQILSHHLEAWCVLLDSLIKRTRNISTHASPKAYLLRSGLAHTLGNACYVYRRCSHTTLSNFTGPYSHVTIIRCVRSRISGSFPLHYSHSLLLLTMFVKKFKD